MKKKRAAAEKIADTLGLDIEEVCDGHYQPSNYRQPSVYIWDDDYYAGCDEIPNHDLGQGWHRVESWRGDVVWCSKMKETF